MIEDLILNVSFTEVGTVSSQHYYQFGTFCGLLHVKIFH